MMKRLLNLGLLFTFLCCYLEWPVNNAMFIFEAEFEILTDTKNWLSNFTHPVILIGFVAELFILYAAIRKDANKKLNNLGIILLTLVVLLFLLVGIIGTNLKIILSTLPFLILSTYYFISGKRSQTPN